MNFKKILEFKKNLVDIIYFTIYLIFVKEKNLSWHKVYVSI